MKTPSPPCIRYHYEIGFPRYVGDMCLDFFSQFEKVQTTFHSKNQFADDHRGVIPIPTRADLLTPQNTLVEIYELADKYDNPTKVMQKALIRCHHMDNRRDYSYVVARDGFIISAWSNAKEDKHRLLKRSVYYSNFYNTDIDIPEVLLEGIADNKNEG